MAPLPGRGLTQLELLCPGGAQHESAAEGGLATLTASLLDEGTPTASALDIARRLESIGGSLATGADWDSIYLAAGVPAEHGGPRPRAHRRAGARRVVPGQRDRAAAASTPRRAPAPRRPSPPIWRRSSWRLRSTATASTGTRCWAATPRSRLSIASASCASPAATSCPPAPPWWPWATSIRASFADLCDRLLAPWTAPEHAAAAPAPTADGRAADLDRRSPGLDTDRAALRPRRHPSPSPRLRSSAGPQLDPRRQVHQPPQSQPARAPRGHLRRPQPHHRPPGSRADRPRRRRRQRGRRTRPGRDAERAAAGCARRRWPRTS